MTTFNLDRAITISETYNPNVQYEYGVAELEDLLAELPDEVLETLCNVESNYFDACETYILNNVVVVGNIDDYNADVHRLAADHGEEFLTLLAIDQNDWS